MTSNEALDPAKIAGASTKIIHNIADAYSGESVAEVEATLIQAITEGSTFGPSEYVPVIAQRIVDGVRGDDLFE